MSKADVEAVLRDLFAINQQNARWLCGLSVEFNCQISLQNFEINDNND